MITNVCTDGTASFRIATDVGWSINVEEAKRALSNHKQQYSGLEDDTTLRFPVRPLKVRAELPETIKIAGRESAQQAVLEVSDMGVISAEIKFDLRNMSLPQLVDFSHQLDEDQSGNLREFGANLIKKLSRNLRNQIIAPELGEDFETYRIFFLKEINGKAQALDLVNSNKAELAQIIKGEVNPLAPEQIEDALKVAISYFQNDRVIIDTRNAVLLGNASFTDVSTVIGFTVVELLELKVMEAFLKKLLETDNSKTSKIGKFSLSQLQMVQQDIAIQRGRVINPLDLNDDQYFADIRRLTAQRLGLEQWAEELNAKLKVVKDISDSLNSRKNHRWAMALEATIVALVGYEVFQMILEKHL